MRAGYLNKRLVARYSVLIVVAHWLVRELASMTLLFELDLCNELFPKKR